MSKRADMSAFDCYVARRLDAWGREFRLDRNFEMLGHRSKNMLAILMEHAGEMPPPNVGFKPLTIPPETMEIEDLVREVHHDLPHAAAVLRAYYCGAGRHRVERRKQAEQLLGESIKVRAYYAYHDLGFHRVAGALMVRARAA